MIPKLSKSQTLLAVRTSSSKDGGWFPKATAICLQTLLAKPWQNVTRRPVHPSPSHPTQRMQRTSCFSATEVPRRKHLTTFCIRKCWEGVYIWHIYIFMFLTNFQICQLIDSNGFACEAKIHQTREERVLAGQFLVLSWWRDASKILFTEKPIGETARSVTEEESRRHIQKSE